MRKRLRLALIIVCILTLAGIRVFSPEDTRICDGTTLVKHGNPTANGSGFFCSGGKIHSFLPIQILSMKISTDFIDNGLMPSDYTCDGEGRFPTLKIEDIPINTKSLALVIEDPDAPAGVRDHLLLANIPLTEDPYVIISQDTFDIAIFGQNSRGELARGAPCPPSETHRYVFKLYALSSMLEISSGFSKERLVELMGGKINAQSQIVGLYKRH
ncbi:MAG: YbhB/YbcL family Raf kinase inhibitor-like protein [candidate division SR1 bacterium]|nr:YbhB/YbcL family Raf kinase inhibitor-like protein [candidate division SR1 bacterium]